MYPLLLDYLVRKGGEAVLAVRNRFKELLAIKEREEDRRITYREVSEATGIHEGTLSKWANQVNLFDGRVVSALCGYFECEIGDLLVLYPDPESSQKLEAATAAQKSERPGQGAHFRG
jgi:DNA-binding Xre family transcriptional regulator